MNNTESESIKRLQETKTKIRESEENILRSQIKQNRIEKKIKKLHLKKEKIINGKQSILQIILSHITYNLVMISVLIIFITQFIEIYQVAMVLQKWVYIIGIYIGVTAISISGALIASKIEKTLKSYLGKKRIDKIIKTIKDKENKMNLEVIRQELLKQEITNIMNKSDNIDLVKLSKIEDSAKYNYNEEELNAEKKTIINHKIRVKKP